MKLVVFIYKFFITQQLIQIFYDIGYLVLLLTKLYISSTYLDKFCQFKDGIIP